MEYLTEGLLWRNPAAADTASQSQSGIFSDIWSGIKNLVTKEEASVELELSNLEPLAEEAREIPRLLSANEAVNTEEVIDFLESEFNELPPVEEAPQFMSPEYVSNLAQREAVINQEFGEAGEVALNQIELVEMGIAPYSALPEEAAAAGELASVLAGEASELLVPMEVEMGPVEAAIGTGVAAALGTATWVGIAAATGIAADGLCRQQLGCRRQHRLPLPQQRRDQRDPWRHQLLVLPRR